MSNALDAAMQYVNAAILPDPPSVDTRERAPELGLQSAKDQAAVVGSGLTSFVRGVSRERRNDIVNATLLAQLVAKKRVPEPRNIDEVTSWYDAYFDVLAHVGFAIQDWGFEEHAATSKDFCAHEAILEVATRVFASTPTVLTVLTATLGALQKKAKDSPWIRLFNRESQTAETARFQITLVSEDEKGQLLVSLMAFGMHAETRLTQVLFFQGRSNEVTLHQYSGYVSIAPDVLDSVRQSVSDKLIGFTSSYIESLPDL